MKGFAASAINLQEAEDSTEKLQTKIGGIVSEMFLLEEELGLSDQEEEADAQVADGQEKKGTLSTDAEANNLPIITGTSAEIQAHSEYDIEKFNIAGFHAGLDSFDPIVDELREQFMETEDCMDHT